MKSNIYTISTEEIEKQGTNEENTKKNYITPILDRIWSEVSDTKIMMEYIISDGRIDLEGDRIERKRKKRADYLLCVKNNIPIAVVEAKSIDKEATEGYQQAINYAKKLGIPFAYSTNGVDLIEEDLITGQNRTIKMIEMPGPDELWNRYLQETKKDGNGIELISYPDYYDSSKPWKKPRYYQRIAINNILEAISEGKQRLLLVLATGTGKTYTAFQIVWKLYKTKNKKKILYLVDRTTLADQTMQKDFKPFVDLGVMKKMQSSTILQDTAYEVFTALYQQLITKENAYYKKLPPDFFDLIIVDECHRGSADVSGNWHEMLEYFNSATQIGLTATPKETEDISNIGYFCNETDGKPIYTYTLKQGIEDGFLAPYKVISIDLNIDKEGYVPPIGKLDVNGEPVERRTYTQKDFDRNIIVEERREIVARRITDYMIQNNCRYGKTIVFCENREHAAAMTCLLRKMSEDLVAENSKYIMRIVSNDSEGEAEIENFTDPNCKYPVIAVTSRLLSTGVDTETVELIVLDKSIGSLTEFKQTIGRGTRIKEDFEIDKQKKQKLFFTILDFRKNYLQFKDPNFDGDPVSVMTMDEKEEFSKGESQKYCVNEEEDKYETNIEKRKKHKVNGVTVTIEDEEVRYTDEDGNLVKENMESCVKNNIIAHYPTFNEFQIAWLNQQDKNTLANNLLIDTTWVTKIRRNIAYNIDKYDIILMYAFDINPLSKEERLKRLLQNEWFRNLPDARREFLELLLNEYKTSDFHRLKDLSGVFALPVIKEAGYTPVKVIQSLFGSRDKYIEFINEMENKLYE